MARSQALDPLVTRTGNDKVVMPQVSTTTSQALDPKCRIFSGDQTVIPEPAQ